MEPGELNPWVRYAWRNRIPLMRPVSAQDSRLFFVLEGRCVLEVPGEPFPLETGMAIYLPREIPYRLCREEHCTFLNVDFDLTRKRQTIAEPLPVTPCRWPQEPPMPGEALFPQLDELNAPFAAALTGEEERTLREVCREFETMEPGWREMCSALLKTVLLGMIRTRRRGTAPPENTALILQFLEEHAAENLPNEAISRATGYCEYHLNRLISARTGMTLHRYVLYLRIRKATELLTGTELTVEEISERTGFSDPAVFSRAFRQVRGMSPRTWRQHGKENGDGSR